MFSALNQLIASFKGLLGREFLLAGFLPVTIASILSAGMAYWCWPDKREPLARLFALDAASTAVNWISVLFVLLLAAFLLWGLNSWFQRTLEGHGGIWSLDRFRRKMESVQQNEWMAFEASLREFEQDIIELRQVDRGSIWIDELRKARNESPSQGRQSGYRLPKTAQAAFEKINAARDSREIVRWEDLEGLKTALVEELEKHGPDDIPAVLDTAQTEFNELTTYALEKLESELGRLWSDKRRRFPGDAAALGPTRFANVAAVHREYARERYGLDVEWVWPRILKNVRADKDVVEILQAARTRLEIAVAMTFVLTVFVLFWSIATFATAGALIPFVVVALAGPLAVRMLYSVALESYQAFSEMVRASIDLYRFDLLKALHIRLPADAGAERTIWQALSRGESLAEEYEHPKDA